MQTAEEAAVGTGAPARSRVRDGAAAGHRRVHLAAFFEGVNHTTVWSHPDAGSQIAPESFEHVARTAERGIFDLLFLGQGLRLRQHRGELFELDVAGRPDALTLYGALASRTSRLGLAATLNTTYTEPSELAAGLAAVDHLTAGRSAWNIVTSSDAYTGGNFRRGGYLPYADRYRRAAEAIGEAERLWSTAPEALPQGRPVYIQAGDSSDGRRFGAEYADVIFSRHTGFDAARRFSEQIDLHLREVGRTRESIRVMPITRVILGDTEAEAEERARENALAQVTGPRALAFAEQVWGRSLEGVDPEGPLPDLDPVRPEQHLMQGRVQSKADPLQTVREWRERAERDGHSLRGLMAEIYGRPHFCGTPGRVAEEFIRYTEAGAVDGFVLGSYLTPGGFDELVDRLVPELQERGAYPHAYEGATAREHLGLARLPFRSTASQRN